MVPAVIGVVCAAVGVLLIWQRAAIARLNADALRAAFGRPAERSARGSTPGTIAFIGAVGIGIGILGIAEGLVSMSR